MVSLLLSACGSRSPNNNPGPQLVQDVTVDGNQVQAVLPTHVQTPTEVSIDSEVVSPLDNVTIDAAFVLITPTLPPSKTATQTPTFTQTPTLTRTPTVTVTATTTGFLLPTSQILPITLPAGQPINEVCDSTWFFLEPRPASCPLNPPLVSQSVYQRFERGHMFWIGNLDAIYVLYSDNQAPLWEVHRDTFEEGMPETDPQYANAPMSFRWQPRRGFGMLWRNNERVRSRLGWAVQEFEQPYSIQVQTAKDGVVFLADPYLTIYALVPNGQGWHDSSARTGPFQPSANMPVTLPTPITFP
ncbi:hypothetical protein MASR2M15_13890 [Anaerolineales bacterium]